MNPPNSENRPEMVFQAFELPMRGGRKVVVWRNANIDCALRAVPILVGSGFARRMSAFAPLAHYLALNGFEVIRYDPLDHVGLSSGDMEDFTMSTGFESMKAVADWMLGERGFDRIGVVATSLSARLAYRLVAQQPRSQFLVTAVGVTALARTLTQVFGTDYSKYRPEDLPRYARFEKHYDISPRPFQADGFEHRWLDLDTTVEELRDCSVPIVSFLGSDDTWVDTADVQAAMGANTAALRHIYTLAGSGHDLGQNAAVARQFLCEMTRACVMLTEGHASTAEAQIIEPTFTAITEEIIRERRLQRGEPSPSLEAAAGVAASATIQGALT